MTKKGVRSNLLILTESSIKGIPQTIKALRRYKKIISEALAYGMSKGLQYLLEETKRVTPKDTGALRDSGYVHVGKVWKHSNRVTGHVAFSAPHAVWVHECTSKHHKPPTKAKFLEETVALKSQEAMRKAAWHAGSYIRVVYGGKLR